MKESKYSLIGTRVNRNETYEITYLYNSKAYSKNGIKMSKKELCNKAICYETLVHVFEEANRLFLENDIELIESNVNERTLCGAFMLHMHDIIKNDNKFAGYYTDIEYNRNKGAIKTAVKTINGPDLKVIKINCDIILHSRGCHPEQDNLIAIEMKKSSRPSREKNEDRLRLMALFCGFPWI